MLIFNTDEITKETYLEELYILLIDIYLSISKGENENE